MCQVCSLLSTEHTLVHSQSNLVRQVVLSPRIDEIPKAQRVSLYSIVDDPLFMEDTFWNPQWMPEITESTKPYLCFFLYVYAYNKG